MIVAELKNHHEQVIVVFEEHFGKEAKLRGVEIGTMAGDLTKALLNYFPNLTLLTIDPWEHREGEGYEAGNDQNYHDRQKKAALHKLHEFGNRVCIWQATSDRVFEMGRDHYRDSDFVWIDGHHSEEQVRRDIENYRKLVRKGGIIGGHDYGLVPDVTKVVDEIYPHRKTGVDFTWWIYK